MSMYFALDVGVCILVMLKSCELLCLVSLSYELLSLIKKRFVERVIWWCDICGEIILTLL